MRIRFEAMALAASALLVLIAGAGTAAGAPERTILRLTKPGSEQSELRVDGKTIATLTRIAAGRAPSGAVAGGAILSAEALLLTAGATTMILRHSESEITPGQAWPRRVRVEGWLEPAGVQVAEEYTLLAPPAPIEVEGWGLEVSWDEEGQNQKEQSLLQDWLETTTGSRDLSVFRNLHATDTGRELVVWYEIAGRRVNLRLREGEAAEPVAEADSLWHVEGVNWKIHHARELSYHRQSMEGVDTIRGADGHDTLRAYHCGCYGWAIGADWVTLGDSLYIAKVEWKHHRVGTGYFLGLTTRDEFPWVGWVDRERISLLSRRAGAYQLLDASEAIFAEVRLSLTSDPPADGLGEMFYSFRLTDNKGELVEFATAKHSADDLVIRLDTPDGLDAALARLDGLLAAMPTQVQRGDGIRDSHLSEIESVVDFFRLARKPDIETLGDTVSELDVGSARAKTRALLDSMDPMGGRFTPNAETHIPLPPERHPESPFSRG
ncbi:MAG: hypothetical protein VCC00_00105 [Deltaproteobacteria bacterium]